MLKWFQPDCTGQEFTYIYSILTVYQNPLGLKNILEDWNAAFDQANDRRAESGQAAYQRIYVPRCRDGLGL